MADLGASGRRVRSQCLRQVMGEAKRFGSWVLPSDYKQRCAAFRSITVRPTDIWVLSYPKCGSTWTREMCWVLANNCDVDAAKRQMLAQRSVFLEYSAILEADRNSGNPLDAVERLNSMPSCSVRVINSHLPIELLPASLFTVKPKIVYVTRDPRDVVVSLYHHYQSRCQYKGNFDDIFDAFYEGDVMYGSYWKYNLEFWETQKQEDCIMFLTYEEMKRDLRSVLRRVADFLGVFIPEKKEDEVLHHLSFEAMKQNPMVNLQHLMKDPKHSFIRAGEAGGWKRVLSPEQSGRMHRQALHWLQDSDFPHYKAQTHSAHAAETTHGQ